MNINERILLECRYLISLNKTYRELAKIFKVSPSTISNDLNERLFLLDKELYYRVKKNISNKSILINNI